MQLGHCGFRGVGTALVLQPGRAVDHQPRGVDLGGHVGDLEGHALERGDRPVELLSLLGIGRCRLVGGLRQPQRHGADPDPAAVERLEEELVARALLAEQVLGGDPAVVEQELPGVRGVEPHLLLHPADGEAGRIGLDDEGADAARVRLALGDGGDDVGARHAGVGDEALAPVQHPAVVDQPRPRAGAARVRPGARLGQPVRPQHLAAGHGAQVALLLLIGAGQVDRVAAEAGVGRDDDPDAPAGAGQLLDGDGVGQGVEAGAAELLRVRDAQQAQLGRLADDLVRELALALQLVGDRHDLALGEVAHRAPDLFVLRAEGEVHARTPFADSVGLEPVTRPGGESTSAASDTETAAHCGPPSAARRTEETTAQPRRQRSIALRARCSADRCCTTRWRRVDRDLGRERLAWFGFAMVLIRRTERPIGCITRRALTRRRERDLYCGLAAGLLPAATARSSCTRTPCRLRSTFG